MGAGVGSSPGNRKQVLKQSLLRKMVDIPVTTEDASGIIIYGVESEQIEEENDAYNDMRAELGRNCSIFTSCTGA